MIKNMNKFITLALLFAAVSLSIVVAAIVSSKVQASDHPLAKASQQGPPLKNGAGSLTQANQSFGTYQQRLKAGWNRIQYSSVVIFGASDCDNAHPRPARYNDTIRGAPYWQGRFTNGPVFGEHLTQGTLTGQNITFLNYAYGDATISNGLVNVNAPDTKSQTDSYLSDVSNDLINRGSGASARVLHCFWIGINDVIQIWTDVIKNGTFQNGNQDGPATGFESAVARINVEVAELMSQVKAVRESPVVNAIPSDFLVMLLPPLEIVPNLYYQSRDLAKHDRQLTQVYINYIGNLTNQYNQGLVEATHLLSQTSNSSATQPPTSPPTFTKIFNAVAYWHWVKENPSKSNFRNVADACWNSTSGGICRNPTAYEYWDTLHPTTTMHKYIAQEITVNCNT